MDGHRQWDGAWLLSPLLLVPATAVVVVMVGLHAGFATLALQKPQADFWDELFKGVAGLITLAGALLATARYLREQKHANEVALIEANKPFAERQQSIYYELISVTALMSNRERDDPARRIASDKFWELYWGAVPMVADLEVGAAVNRFSEALDDPDDGVRLRNRSMDLAMACRNSLGFVRPDSRPPKPN